LKKNGAGGARLSKWFREKLMRRAPDQAPERKTGAVPRA
jgi:hypothetical protein